MIMSLNSLGGTTGYYYPGMFNSGAHARNRHVGGFSNDDANAGNTHAASQNSAANGVNASNLTQNAPQATGAAQSVGQSGNQGSQAGSSSNSSGTGSSAGSTSSTLSPDFQSEENVLSTLMDKSLEAMNLVPSSEIAGTQINFSGLSYDVSSSVSAAVGVQGNQASAALDESQSATLEGEGQIVTPDGTTYNFTVALQVGEDQQVGATTPLQGDGSGLTGLPSGLLSGLSSLGNGSNQATQGGAATPVDATNGSSGSGDTSATSLSNYLAQLLSEMQQSASQSLATDPNSFLQSPAAATSATSSASPSASSASSGSTSAQPTINWDAIQKQTSSLIDMLDAMISANQGANGSSAASSANAAATGATQSSAPGSNNTTAAAAV
jgi:hypothetical protein